MSGDSVRSSGRQPRAAAPIPRLTRAEHFWHGVAIGGFAIQALTGFVGKYIFGEVSGWLLLIHMLGAPVFIVGLTATALMWAERCRFSPEAPGGLRCAQKLMFWVATVLGLVVMAPMLVAMLPLFGYAGQHALTEIHEVSALLLLAAMAAHTLLSLAVRRIGR